MGQTPCNPGVFLDTLAAVFFGEATKLRTGAKKQHSRFLTSAAFTHPVYWEDALKKYEIDFVAITPRERGDIPNNYKVPFNEEFFRQRYPIVVQQGEYVLYKIR